MQSRRRVQGGMTLIEMLLALAIAGFLVAGLAGTVGQTLDAWSATRARLDVVEQAHFALERMERAVRGSPQLVLPLAENPATAWSESSRDVLALVLDPRLDRDDDGFADADNDRDGRVDEDPPKDNNNDGKAGIEGIDDDGDGSVDEGDQDDDDEDQSLDEDSVDGIDSDGDGAVDEDRHGDLNRDSAPGVAGIDDDGDGSVDESILTDDDEDKDQVPGNEDEDWYDSVVFYLSSGSLVERFPNPHASDGTDYEEYTLAEGVTQFQVVRVPAPRGLLVDITLELTDADGRAVSLATRVRVGGEL